MGFLAQLLPKSLKHWLLSQLDDSEEKFSRVFHTSPDWIVITRLSDSLIVEANLGFQEMSGYRREEVLGHPIKDFNVWAVPEQRQLLVDELMRNGYARNHLVKMRRRDGTIRDCLASCTTIALKGNIHTHAVWVARDITDQIIASEQFSAAFLLTPDCMTISRMSDGTYIEVNSAFERTIGLERKDIIGKTVGELQIWIDPERRNVLIDLLRKNHTVTDFPAIMKLHQGEVRETVINAVIFESRGEELMIALTHDVTDIREAQRKILDLNLNLERRVNDRTVELEATNHELINTLDTLKMTMDQLVQSEKLAALGSLVAGIAHELNTPIGNSLTVASTQEELLRTIRANFETGIKRSELDKFFNELSLATEILMRNLGRAVNLVDSFKQVAVDRTSSQRRVFSLSDHIEKILVSLYPMINKSSCKIETDIDDDILLDSFPGALSQVVINLVENAMKHGFSTMDPGVIHIDAKKTGTGQVILQIQDNGNGISPEHIHRIFEPFFTTRLGQGGSGLGLHIVHNIVTDLLGGSIEVSSAGIDLGALFTLILPLTAPEKTPMDDD
ncbi:PAS domain-containing sensor histidine kinase [Undibacterium sp. Xuan67W]|uniref:PAS domain-containing sensor histidine kinase n=1 Tax=Undibacterium sp. Xuan67W TaxID=3413057 RepID=UPI003BF29500